MKWSVVKGGKQDFMGKVYISKVVRSEGLGWKREYNMRVGKNTRNYIRYFLTLVLFTFMHVVF